MTVSCARSSLFAAVFATGTLFAAAAPVVRSDFPGGNGHLEGVDADARVLTVRKEPRGSGDNLHYYFYFEVSGLSGMWTVRIVDTPTLTRMGPAVSTDSGETWRFLFDKPVPPPGVETFDYEFPADGSPVRFCVSIPYGEKEWNAFVGRHAGNASARQGELCKDRSGRPVERFDIVNDSGRPDWTFVFTARHHACEVSASAVLEGILDEALSDSPEGRWVRANGQVVALPFMDKDGVVAGDQGKSRLPHDHNRDYIQEIYPSVKALKRYAAGIPGKVYHVDLHSPALKGHVHDHIFTVCPEGVRRDARWRAFSRELEKASAGAALKYDPQWSVPVGHASNNARHFTGDGTLQTSRRWFTGLPNCYLSTCMEFGYGLCSGVYSRDGARELGRNVMKALVRSIWRAPADDGIAKAAPRAADEARCGQGGCRCEPREVEYPRTVVAGERVMVGSTWVNVGAKPCCAEGVATWCLLDEGGAVCWRAADDALELRDLKPKLDGVEHPASFSSYCTFGRAGDEASLPRPGRYTLAVSVGRRCGAPEVAARPANGAGRVYSIGEIAVSR